MSDTRAITAEQAPLIVALDALDRASRLVPGDASWDVDEAIAAVRRVLASLGHESPGLTHPSDLPPDHSIPIYLACQSEDLSARPETEGEDQSCCS